MKTLAPGSWLNNGIINYTTRVLIQPRLPSGEEVNCPFPKGQVPGLNPRGSSFAFLPSDARSGIHTKSFLVLGRNIGTIGGSAGVQVTSSIPRFRSWREYYAAPCESNDL